jgi:hypothetical protein
MDSGHWKTMGELLDNAINDPDRFKLKILGRKANKRRGIEEVEGIKGFGKKRVDAILEILNMEYRRDK